MMEKLAVLRVLVVDDELLIRWSIAETLAEAGHAVVEAADGKGALQAIAAEPEPIDVVLLDYRLPDSDDLELLANIRRLSPSSSVVLMTAFGAPDVERGALDLGAYDVVTKPFDVHGLNRLVLDAHGARPH